MAGTQPYWGQQNDMNNVFFGLDTDIMEHNHREHQQVSEGFESKFPHSPLYSGAQDSSMPRSHRGDQVVPSFQRLSVYEGPQRCPKPLPPLPDQEGHSSDDAADDEVEFFTDDRRRLLPLSCPDKALALRYGAPSRRSFRGCGQVNYAYHEGPAGASGDGACGWASSATGGRVNDGASIEVNGWTSSRTRASVKVGASGYANVRTCGGPKREALEQQHAQFGQGVQAAAAVRDVPSKQPDRPQRNRLRRSHSGPAGSFKPAGVRLACHLHHHHHQPHHHGSCRGYPQDKPEVPPRAPIPPRPSKAFTADCHRWSVHDTDEDKPPAVPPREPLTPSAPPRTPSPRSLPIYVNGVMPPTQSFAPNPKYVSRVPQRQQQSDRAAAARPSLGPPSPCIVPVMEDGRKASATHYFLLPRRPAYMDRLERFLIEADCEASSSACTSEWQKPPLQST